MNTPIYMDRRQTIVAASTARGWQSPHVSFVCEADVTGALSRLAELNSGRERKIAANTMFVYLITAGIKACPAANAHVNYSRWLATGSVTFIEKIDINMPVILPSGKMITVKLPDFGAKTLTEMQDCIDKLMRKISLSNSDIPLMETAVRDTVSLLKKGDLFRPLGRLLGLKLGKNRVKGISAQAKRVYKAMPAEDRLNSDDVNLGTVTISNLGAAVKNIRGFPALIDLVSPQVLAVGIGPLYEAAGRRLAPLCFVFDHRALDFGDIAPLIRAVDALCGNPEGIV